MAKYVKKPVVIEAIQWTGQNNSEIESFMNGSGLFLGGDVLIATLEGDMTASTGDWIIRGIKGELYPCKPDVFEQTYQRVKD